ncbi:HutD/Ves family protein [Janthinobacterium sp. BJB1]|uniref:HutD/Ves family protein n=1 Tax=Janthinobacterium sp. GW458P TaxID=1981504 RepID=UPI000A3271C6|nr:HutD family protein [Janthinobacterium sp. GW458P]MBE3023943.1 HutD family protein [Janthinobacterium sp. GW458P]PHV18427.1 HutD/Ves family protein [Janthinobacterium sp. BJB303]PJC99241.1 HutD/Ves family protein [Janthinobacterium sp. BJB1]
MATFIPHECLRAAPWKNGGGSTMEIAISPPAAGLMEFDWRISLATITASGPFSSFPGIDRSLMLVDGDSVQLTLDGARKVTLSAAQPMLWFPGEAAVVAQVRGPTTDFNVMTRRDRCRHQLEKITAPAKLARRSATTLLFVAGDGAVLARGGGQQFALARHDALLLDADDAQEWRLEALQRSAVLSVDLFT